MTQHGAKTYGYVGPAELTRLISTGNAGTPIADAEDFVAWIAERSADELAEPFTFVVDTGGRLRLAARRSEHVVCAGGEHVLSAGEITFAAADGNWLVAEISNQSTGYCPGAESWPAAAAALDRAGLAHPGRFTVEVVFRRCPDCGEMNVVKEDFYVCALCDADLPS